VFFGSYDPCALSAAVAGSNEYGELILGLAPQALCCRLLRRLQEITARACAQAEEITAAACAQASRNHCKGLCAGFKKSLQRPGAQAVRNNCVALLRRL